MQKLNKFVRSARFEVVLLEWLSACNEAGLFARISPEEQNEYMDTLY